MTETVSVSAGEEIVADLIRVISENKAYLSEIDGAIGDGDHGINMAKGFALCGEQISGKTLNLSVAFDTLSDALMEGIGGSMGPLYGSFFMGMAQSIRDKSTLTAAEFAQMLRDGLTSLREISSASAGDKCLMDTLIPAVSAAERVVASSGSFSEMLTAMQQAAEQGRDSTVDLVAKIGRASRLGERSRGVLDAGATSCYLLLNTLATTLKQRLSLI